MWWWWLVGCTPPAPECGPEQCADQCPEAPAAAPPTAPAAGLSAFEQGLVQPLLDDLRQGIRPWSASAIGLCRGKRTCDAFLGLDGGELPPGDYVVRAELGVPQLGGPGAWTAEYHSTCRVTTLDKEGTPRTRTEQEDATHILRYAGPNQGFKLEPLEVIHSPAPGRRECTWTLTLRQPDTTRELKGGWIVPAAAPEAKP